jgi:hypothetical protein
MKRVIMRTIGGRSCHFAFSFAGLFAFGLLSEGVARADEPRSATEPRVMSEPGWVVDVIDAFDDGDPFDVNITLGFQYASKSARILRESTIARPGLTTGGFTSRTMNVADYKETTSKLVPRLDIGIYKDLAAHISLPIILNNARSLSAIQGSDRAPSGFVAPALAGAPGEKLFNLPFQAPNRSGLEHIAIGLDINIFNQARDRTKPTWLFGFEGRFSVGTPMHACNPNKARGQIECADPGDINRDGRQQGSFEAQSVAPRSAGITRGTNALEVHTLLSKRVKYLEPYGGFAALFEFQNSSSDYGITDLEGSLVNHPPLVGTMTLGLMVHPYENREKHSRVTIDLRFQGEYHSEGRDYSELFDALGSSNAGSLRQPQWSGYRANPACPINSTTGCSPSIVDEGSQKTYFTGLSDVHAYGSYRGSISAMWQASEFVRFHFGVGYRHDQAHGISDDQPCNPDLKNDLTRAGPCKTGGQNGQQFVQSGLPNPNYRASINAVGRRFFVDSSNTFDIFASGVVMF